MSNQTPDCVISTAVSATAGDGRENTFVVACAGPRPAVSALALPMGASTKYPMDSCVCLLSVSIGSPRAKPTDPTAKSMSGRVRFANTNGVVFVVVVVVVVIVVVVIVVVVRGDVINVVLGVWVVSIGVRVFIVIV